MVSQLKSLIIGGDTTVWNWLKYCFTDGGHHVIRQKGLPSAAIDVLPIQVQVEAEATLSCAVDNVTEWSGRSVKELS